MKKIVVLTIAMLIACIVVKSQNDITFSTVPELNHYEICTEVKTRNDTTIYITQSLNNQQFNICLDRYDCVVLYGVTDCDYFTWGIGSPYGYQNSTENPIYLNYSFSESFGVSFNGCGYRIVVGIEFIEPNVPNETTEEKWVHYGEFAELHAVGADSTDMYSFHWDTGETENVIYKPGGTYVVGISDLCATSFRTKNVKENVEIYCATVDLESNLNKAIWQVTAEQAEYISEVKVYRDGMFVGTAPYEQGYYLDAIGSDNAARNYQLVGVTPEGEDCPIASYEKGTIHTTYYQDVNNNLNMTWNIPYVQQGAQGTLTYFQICKYDPNTGDLTVVDQVNSSITDYTCGVNQFEGGYPVIAAVFSDSPFVKGDTGDSNNRDFEDLSFSNMGTDILVQPNEITITLMPGWTWISYPYAAAMDIATALGDFVPMEGDVIKSQFGMTEYHNGQWTGGLQQFTPGFGIMYYSARSVPATLVFGTSTSKSTRKTVVE